MSSKETRLWHAVILQAITDATLPLDVRTLRERLDRQRARDWFLMNDDDYRAACYRADLDPDRVRRYVLPLIAEATKLDLPPPERKSRKPRAPTGRIIEHNGKAMTLVAWAIELGLSKQALYDRLQRGMPLAEALTKSPPRKPRRRATTTPGVGQHRAKSIHDRHIPSAQETPKLEIF
ncbi:hypothetical protein [Bradyrhizobium sp. Cp5.3]|uniref:hypothetical protein n=1 Tax=Bradyrhizobium sp. Cp5.3 TaxID=443598 RepID=UPI0004828971|nr:hypothetical protein [Bradyrhizobium sp. Cp5.3]